jgi:hypothetical protein
MRPFENVGILMASGLIASEALTGPLFAFFKFRDIPVLEFFKDPSYVDGKSNVISLMQENLNLHVIQTDE